MTAAIEDPTSAGVRHGPLTWGQHLLWAGYLATPPARRHQHTVVQRLDVPTGATPAAVAAALDALAVRHETFRTTYHVVADGTAVQVVHPPAPVPLERLTATDRAAADAMVAGATAGLKRVAFDLAQRGSVRATVILAGPTPAHLLVAAHHISVDGWSWGVLRREFDALVRRHLDGSAPALPPAPWQPLDQADYEQSEQGQRANATALRYWERQFDVMPDRVLPSGGDSRQADQRVAVLDSPALAAALAWLGRRHQIVDSTLLITAFAAVLGVATGRDQSIVMTMTSNRLGGRSRDVVACLAQYTVVALDLRGDPPFTELVARGSATVFAAYRHGHYDFQEMKAREREHAQRRGLCFSQPAGLNFKQYTDQRPERSDPGSPPVLSRDDTRAVVSPAAGSCARGVVLLTVRPSAGSTGLELLCDATAMSPDDMLGLVRTMEAFLVEAVTDPGLRLSALPGLCGLGGPALGSDWAMVDNCWVDLRDVEQVLRACPGVTGAAVFVEPDPAERGSLVAYVAADDGIAPAQTLRRHLLEAADTGRAVIAPHRYVMCRQPPAEPQNAAAWLEQAEPDR